MSPFGVEPKNKTVQAWYSKRIISYQKDVWVVINNIHIFKKAVNSIFIIDAKRSE